MEKEKGKPLILAVDQDEDVLNLLGLTLDGEGYKVLKTMSGIEALDLARYCPQIKAAVLNIHLPTKDLHELELAEILGILPETEKIPLLLLSANQRLLPGWAKDARTNKRAVDYLAEPFDLDEFFVKVKHLVNKVRPEPT